MLEIAPLQTAFLQETNRYQDHYAREPEFLKRKIFWLEIKNHHGYYNHEVDIKSPSPNPSKPCLANPLQPSRDSFFWGSSDRTSPGRFLKGRRHSFGYPAQDPGSTGLEVKC
jgi:hypothetical protein